MTSRRQLLTLAGAGLAGATVAGLALPRKVFAQPSKKVTILHGSGSVLLAWAPSFIAEELGYYKEEGLTVERVFNGSGPAGLGALVGGSGTILLNPPGEALTAAARGQKIKFIMAHSDYQVSEIVLSKAYAAKLGLTENMPYAQKVAIAKKNFKGIRCGVTSPGSLSDHAALAVLQGLGIDPKADAQVVPLGSVPNAIAAMGRGALDAFSGAAPAGEIAKGQQGAVVVFRNSKDEMPGYKTLSGHLVNARASDVQDDPELYAAIVRADTRGMRYIIENTKAAGEILAKSRYPSLSKDVWADVWANNAGQFGSPYVTKPSVESWITLGVMPTSIDKKAVDIDSMIDMRFVDQAVKKLGWKVPA